MASDSNWKMYESALIGILQNEGKIEPFLDTIFSFLYNCTDFYRILRNPNDKYGFPPGIAQQIVLNAFRKFEKLSVEDEKEKLTKSKEVDDVPLPSKIVEIKSCEVQKETEATPKNESLPLPKTPELPDENEDEEDNEELDEDAKQLKQEQKVYQNCSESYNGAIRENYSWSQSIHEVDVHLKVPKEITKGKLVKVKIDREHLYVAISEKGGEQKVLVDGDLCWRINVENSCWTLQPGETVHINLEKVQERWWDALITDEPKINIRNIDACRPMGDLGEEEQAKIQELMFNEQQKRLGKPTSEQTKIQNILKEAWDKEGSPFKGQQFDPSAINISSSGDVLFGKN